MGPFCLGPGERLFEAASPIMVRYGPFTIRADGIKKEAEARQYVAQVLGILRMLETTVTGNALIVECRERKKPVLIFPLEQLDDEQAYAWVYPRTGLFSVGLSFSPLFGRRLRDFLGGEESEFENRVWIPQEVLAHELVHVCRAVSGNFARMDSEDEEELAAMVAGMFSVEVNRPPINNYEEQISVPNDWAGFSKKYYKENFEMIETFCRQNRNLAHRISYARTAFNPLRLYIDENL